MTRGRVGWSPELERGAGDGAELRLSRPISLAEAVAIVLGGAGHAVTVDGVPLVEASVVDEVDAQSLQREEHQATASTSEGAPLSEGEPADVDAVVVARAKHCEKCGALPGERCRSKDGKERDGVHSHRTPAHNQPWPSRG